MSELLSGFDWVQPNKGRGGARGLKESDLVGISTHHSNIKDTKRERTPNLSICFYKPMIDELRWLLGDRVMVGLDETNKLIAVKRSMEGYALTLNGGSVKDAKKKGVRSLRVNLPAPVWALPKKMTRLDDTKVQVIDGGVIIDVSGIGD